MLVDLNNRQALRQAVARRVAEVRRDLYGEEGLPTLADSLGLPVGTWMNYEQGVTMPAITLLRLIDLTAVEPRWLLTGEGAKYRPSVGPP